MKPRTGRSGRQFSCGTAGVVDLLCWDRKGEQYVVVELKNVTATLNTVEQIDAYLKWVRRRVAKKKPVVGLVISRDTNEAFDEVVGKRPDLRSLDISELGFG